MSLVQHRTKYLGWAYESTQGIDPISIGGGVQYYEFGKLTDTFGNFPAKDIKSIAR